MNRCLSEKKLNSEIGLPLGPVLASLLRSELRS